MRRLSRLISIALLPLIGAAAASFGAYFLSLDHRLSAVEIDRAARIVATDNHLVSIDRNVNGLQDDVSAMKIDTHQTQLDVATMKGILQQLQQDQHVADLLATRPAPRP